MFDADRPINKSSQDKLNRSQFAKYLARSMLDHTDPNSFVIGLNGGWGVGKTSLINLILEELNFAASNLEDQEKPIILSFNPWNYSGQYQLINSFFRRLSSAMQDSPLEDKDRIIYLLELYMSFFTQQVVPEALRIKPSLLEKMTFARSDEVYGWESGLDLINIKTELNQLLQTQKHKIIITIDNISRLYPQEIAQIFQIIKSIGDFTHTIYLLAFNRIQVVKGINKIAGMNGHALVEKIVQLPFEIPPILPQDLENILFERLSEMMAIVPQESFAKEYWADIYTRSLKFFFHNVRDITRYINTLNFGYYRLRDLVNPVDFFSLTAIEVFIPEVYFSIRENKDLFTDLLDNVYELNIIQIEQDKMRCDDILSQNKKIHRNVLLELLMQLFPRLRNLYQPELRYFHSPSIARKLKRICSPDLFDIYFRLSMQTGQMTPSEFDTILSFASDPESFDHALTRLNQDDRILKFIDMLDSPVVNTIPLKDFQGIVTALLNNGDLFPPGISGPFNLGTAMRIHRIIHGLLQRLDRPNDRFLILQQAIAQATKSIYISVHELIAQGREHQAATDTFLPAEFRDLTVEQLELLRKLVASRIENWADNGRLAEHPHLLPLLYAWRDFGDAQKCQAFVLRLTQTDPGLIAFLMATLDQAIAQAMIQYEKNPYWQKYLEDITAFVSLDKLATHAKLLFEDQYFEKLREKEQLALMIFLDLIKAPTNKIIPQTSP